MTEVYRYCSHFPPYLTESIYFIFNIILKRKHTKWQSFDENSGPLGTREILLLSEPSYVYFGISSEYLSEYLSEPGRCLSQQTLPIASNLL